MIAALPPYFYKMVLRIMLLALGAVGGGAGAGLAVVLPSSLLRSLGLLSFSLEDSNLLWPVLILAGFWGMAHTLDATVRITNARRQ